MFLKFWILLAFVNIKGNRFVGCSAVFKQVSASAVDVCTSLKNKTTFCVFITNMTIKIFSRFLFLMLLLVRLVKEDKLRRGVSLSIILICTLNNVSNL